VKTVRFLFNDAMARAIVDGRKTVTRRPVHGVEGYGVAPCHFSSTGFASVERVDGQAAGRCICSREVNPPCVAGDLLIGRECWAIEDHYNSRPVASDGRVIYRATGDDVGDGRWRPSIHMPDWAARIRRRVVSVTVERLQDISEADAVREGFAASEELMEFHRNCAPPGSRLSTPRERFAQTWDDIYAAKGIGWAVNPWVWRIEFAGENERGPTP